MQLFANHPRHHLCLTGAPAAAAPAPDWVKVRVSFSEAKGRRSVQESELLLAQPPGELSPGLLQLFTTQGVKVQVTSKDFKAVGVPRLLAAPASTAIAALLLPAWHCFSTSSTTTHLQHHWQSPAPPAPPSLPPSPTEARRAGAAAAAAG